MTATGFSAVTASDPCSRPSARAERVSLEIRAVLSPAFNRPRTAVNRPPAAVQAVKTPAESMPCRRLAPTIVPSTSALSRPCPVALSTGPPGRPRASMRRNNTSSSSVEARPSVRCGRVSNWIRSAEAMGKGWAPSSAVKVGRIISARRSGKRSLRWLMLKRRPSPAMAIRPLSARLRIRPSGATTTQWSGFQLLASATSSGAATPWPEGARMSVCGIDTRVRKGQPVMRAGAWEMVQPSCRRTSTWAASRVSTWSLSQNHQPVQPASRRPTIMKGTARPRREWRGAVSVIGAPSSPA